MTAGREMDALVAEHVMGVTILRYEDMAQEAERVWIEQPHCRSFLRDFWATPSPDGPVCTQGFRPYSTDIAAAWEVVKRLADRFHCRVHTPFEPGLQHFAGFTPLGWTGWNGRPDHEAGADTAPLAICRAALKAVGAEVPV